MEIIVGIFIIVLLLLLCGADWGFIALLGFAALALVLLVISGFFVYALVLVLRSEKVSGAFTEIKKRDGGFPQAWYSVGGEEFPNMFPCEVLLQSRIYVKDKQVPLRLLRKKRLVFDKNALGAVAVGVLFCLPSAVIILVTVLRFLFF